MPPKRRASPSPLTSGRVTRSRSAANSISNNSTAGGAPASVASSVAGVSEINASVQGTALSRGQRPKGLAAVWKARSGQSSESTSSTAVPGDESSRPQGSAPTYGAGMADFPAPRARERARGVFFPTEGRGTAVQRREVTHHHLEMVQERLEQEKTERAAMGNEYKKRKIASPRNWAAGLPSAGPSGSNWNPIAAGNETGKTHTSSDEEKESDYSGLLGSSYDDSDENSEWEDVDLNAQAPRPSAQHAPQVAPGSLNLILDSKREGKGKEKSVARGRTAAERHNRLEIHQTHLLCLLAHAYKRSQWCNYRQVQNNLEPLVNRRVRSLLIPNPRDQQFKRAFNFLEGLNTAVELWLNTFHITRKGVLRPHWGGGHLETTPRNGDPPMDKEDFLAASLHRTGSRDLGAQLFCALLRSIGVTCRLVCSLQPLSFSFRESRIPPKKPLGSSTSQSSVDGSSGNSAAPADNGFGGPGLLLQGPSEGTVLRLPEYRDPVSTEHKSGGVTLGDDPDGLAESKYPVFWVEAWSIARQKWIPVDPLVTRTVGKPSVIEPPMSDQANLMSYVVAFDQDGHCRDVTKRYAKIYNGKTLKLRVTRTRAGELWWDRAINTFYRGWDLDRDDLEDSELQGKLVSEPMPKSIQDFKDHPLYVLKRHLKRGEVIHPEKQVGSVPVGGKGKGSEPVYTRRDLKVVRTAQQWHMRGREIQAGEQPLKYTVSRRLAGKNRKLGGSDEDYDNGSESEDEDNDERGKMGMYAEFQTTLYEPPPVVNGLVPKNGYGNLDIFAPSMVPNGAVHLPFDTAEKAAKLIGVDYANAITGFKFSRRQALPIVTGVVVATEYKAAVLAVVDGLQDQDEEEEAIHKDIVALMRWKRFIIRLRIKERLSIYDDPPQEDQLERTNPKGKGSEHSGGGFVAASADGDDGSGDGFFIGGGDEEGGGGGFLIGDSGEEGGGGGGFVIEDGGSERPQEEEKGRSESEMDSDMLSEDPEDKDNEDLDWM